MYNLAALCWKLITVYTVQLKSIGTEIQHSPADT